jgi:hypothetical protein
VRDDSSGPVPVVEGAISRLGLAIDAGRAFLCLGRGRRCFFIAYSRSLTIAGRRAKCPVLGCEARVNKPENDDPSNLDEIELASDAA